MINAQVHTSMAGNGLVLHSTQTKRCYKHVSLQPYSLRHWSLPYATREQVLFDNQLLA